MLSILEADWKHAVALHLMPRKEGREFDKENTTAVDRELFMMFLYFTIYILSTN